MKHEAASPLAAPSVFTRSPAALTFATLTLVTLTLVTLSIGATAQDYPTKPVRIVLPFPPGGLVDPLTRTVSQKAQEYLGQPFVIEHRPGSGGVIAAAYMKQQPSDGYSLFLGSAGTHATNKALYSKLPYDPQKDFVPITILGSVASILMVPGASPAKTVPELLALGKSKTGGLSHATPGIGTPGHLISAMLSAKTGTPITQIHYNAAPQAMQDTLAGRVDMYFAAVVSSAGLIREGKLRALAIAAQERSKVLPDVPTLTELGLPGIDLELWFGLFAPAGTPQPAVRRLYESFARALKAPEVTAWLVKQELTPPMVTPEQFASLIAADIDRLGKAVRDSGAKAD
jgi:tripartite-type tricarboxylate transporter receptor subunit TctC